MKKFLKIFLLVLAFSVVVPQRAEAFIWPKIVFDKQKLKDMITRILDHGNQAWVTFQDFENEMRQFKQVDSTIKEYRKRFAKVDSLRQVAQEGVRLMNAYDNYVSYLKYYKDFYANYDFSLNSVAYAMRGPLNIYNQGKVLYDDTNEFLDKVGDEISVGEVLSKMRRTRQGLENINRNTTAAIVKDINNTATVTSSMFSDSEIAANAFNMSPASGIDLNFGLRSVSSETDTSFKESEKSAFSLASGWEGIVQLLLLLASAFCLVMSGIKFSQGNPEGTRMFLSWFLTVIISFVILLVINKMFLGG